MEGAASTWLLAALCRSRPTIGGRKHVGSTRAKYVRLTRTRALQGSPGHDSARRLRMLTPVQTAPRARDRLSRLVALQTEKSAARGGAFAFAITWSWS